MYYISWVAVLNLWGKRERFLTIDPRCTILLHLVLITLHRSLLQFFFLISAKQNFHQPLVCIPIPIRKSGSSVWQISKKYFAGVIYGKKSLMCQLCSLKHFPHKFTSCRVHTVLQFSKEGGQNYFRTFPEHLTP